MGGNTIECPKCGHENDASAGECEKCGVTFSLFFKGTRQEKKAAPAAKPGSRKQTEARQVDTCPKCGYKVVPPAAECIKCGIIFQKFFEVQERKQKEEQERAEAEQIEREAREKEERERAEAEKKEKELREKEEKRRIEAEKKERERKEKEERERKEKENAAGEKIKVGVSSEAENEKLTNLKREVDILKKENENLKKENEEKERSAALQKEKANREKEEVSRIDEENKKKIHEMAEESRTLKSDFEELKKKNEALEKAEALRKEREEKEKAEILRKEQEEKEKAEAVRKEREDQQKRMETILKTLVPQPNFVALLKKYEGQEIGINFEDPAEIKGARLAKVNEDHFSILDMESELLYSYSLSNILSIVEAMNGVPVDAGGQKTTYPIVVRVAHLMAKKKWGFM